MKLAMYHQVVRTMAIAQACAWLSRKPSRAQSTIRSTAPSTTLKPQHMPFPLLEPPSRLLRSRRISQLSSQLVSQPDPFRS